MNKAKVIHPRIKSAFDKYPEPTREKLLELRKLILEVAAETEAVDAIEETLKWGEPSYLAKKGSTIRLGVPKAGQYAIYFHCKTKLVETFRALYGEKLKFDGNRAIVFELDDELPLIELKHCVALSLTYHSRKNLPMLGA